MLFNALSYPYQGDFVSLAANLSCRLFCSTLAAANRFAREVGAPTLDLDPALIAPDRFATSFWCPEVGRAAKLLTERRAEEAPLIVGQLAIAAFLNGALRELDLDVRAERGLVIAGHSLRGPRLQIQGADGRLTVREGHEVLTLTRADTEAIAPAWTAVGDSVIRLGDAGLAVFSDGLCLDQWGAPEHLRCDPSREHRVRIEDAVEILRHCGPAYYAWIVAVLREVVPLAKPGRGTSSSSHVAYPGQLRISARGSRIEYVNMLVHECSHQYFNLMQSFVPVVRPDAPEVYSALKECNRPLEKVLLGFHAVGNMLFAYEALLDSGAPVETNEIFLERDAAAEIAVSLYDSLEPHWDSHLEQAGRELYVPMRDWLRAADLLDTPRHAASAR